jgi:hypothetical protein
LDLYLPESMQLHLPCQPIQTILTIILFAERKLNPIAALVFLGVTAMEQLFF